MLLLAGVGMSGGVHCSWRVVSCCEKVTRPSTARVDCVPRCSCRWLMDTCTKDRRPCPWGRGWGRGGAGAGGSGQSPSAGGSEAGAG